MLAKLVFTEDATLDVVDAYVWYEGRRDGLGEDFLSCVEASLGRIRRQPSLYPIVHAPWRRALIRRFPYAIFFEQLKNTITVYAVFHTARDPQKWRERR